MYCNWIFLKKMEINIEKTINSFFEKINKEEHFYNPVRWVDGKVGGEYQFLDEIFLTLEEIKFFVEKQDFSEQEFFLWLYILGKVPKNAMPIDLFFHVNRMLKDS